MNSYNATSIRNSYLKSIWRPRKPKLSLSRPRQPLPLPQPVVLDSFLGSRLPVKKRFWMVSNSIPESSSSSSFNPQDRAIKKQKTQHEEEPQGASAYFPLAREDLCPRNKWKSQRSNDAAESKISEVKKSDDGDDGDMHYWAYDALNKNQKDKLLLLCMLDPDNVSEAVKYIEIPPFPIVSHRFPPLYGTKKNALLSVGPSKRE